MLLFSETGISTNEIARFSIFLGIDPVPNLLRRLFPRLWYLMLMHNSKSRSGISYRDSAYVVNWSLVHLEGAKGCFQPALDFAWEQAQVDSLLTAANILIQQR